MELHPTVAQHLDEIRAAAERYGVERLEIFGSAMTSKFDPDRSDVDFIVHYPRDYDYGYFLKQYLDFEDELAEILGRSAQLVMTSALKKERFRRNAEMTRTTIYVASALDSGTSGHQEVLSTHS